MSSRFSPRSLFVLTLLLGAVAASRVHASCGAEGCPLDNSLLDGGTGRLSFELSYQQVEQDRLWTDRGRGDEDHVLFEGGERRTLSRVTTGKAIYKLNRSWLFSASLPYVSRIHEHVSATDLPEPEIREWQYGGLGDMNLLASWTALEWGDAHPLLVSLQGGVKLPTGRREIPEILGETLEPHARPGTGSTDLLAGLQLLQQLPIPSPSGGNTALFASALYMHTTHGTEGYRVGRMLEVHSGASYPVLHRLRLLAQTNLRVRGKDDVEEEAAEGGGHDHLRTLSPEHEEPGDPAEPGHHDEMGNTGGVAMYLTPGMRLEASPWLALSAHLQVPVYQRVNGTQLVAPAQFWLGATYKLR
jgi:hypothetical protein